MRPVALLVALCLTPAAEACFLKCFRGKINAAAGGSIQSGSIPSTKITVKLPAVVILTIDGQPAESGPTVSAGVAGVPVRVQTSFDPTGLTPGHELVPGGLGSAPGPLQSIQVQQVNIIDPSGGPPIVAWQFTYVHLPELKSATSYSLRIAVPKVASDVVRFRTP